ncbi:hypothetical protein IWQ61_002556 [Dispira simplex]|nr:hypothetical protein IWQ61_002556 [Dispira simplex]
MPPPPSPAAARMSLAGSSSSQSFHVHQNQAATPVQRSRGFSSPSGHTSDTNSLRSALTHWSESDLGASLASTNHPNISLASVSSQESAEGKADSSVVAELWTVPVSPQLKKEILAVQSSLSPSSFLDGIRLSCASPTLPEDRRERGHRAGAFTCDALPTDNAPRFAHYESPTEERNPADYSTAQQSRLEQPSPPSSAPAAHPKAASEEWQWYHIGNHTARPARGEPFQDPARVTTQMKRLNLRHHRASSQPVTKIPTQDHPTRPTAGSPCIPSGVDPTMPLADSQQCIAKLTNRVLTLELELVTLKAQKAQEALRCERQLAIFLARQPSPSPALIQQSEVTLALLKDVISAYEGRFQDLTQSPPSMPPSTRDVGYVTSDVNITAASHPLVPAANSPDMASELMALRRENELLKLKLHAFNQPPSRDTVPREANKHASNDKRLLTRAFIHQDKQYWKYQLWKVDDMNPLDCRHLIKDIRYSYQLIYPTDTFIEMKEGERRTVIYIILLTSFHTVLVMNTVYATQEFMLLFKVNDPRHLMAWLSLRRLKAAERRTRPG